MQAESTSLMTTAPAPMMLPEPIVTSGMIVARRPTHTCRPISTRRLPDESIGRRQIGVSRTDRAQPLQGIGNARQKRQGFR